MIIKNFNNNHTIDNEIIDFIIAEYNVERFNSIFVCKRICKRGQLK